MRIALVGPVYPYRGGIAHFTTRMALELEAAGHEVLVISFSRQYPAWLYPGKSDKDPSARHEKTQANFILDPLYFWTWHQAARRIVSFNPNIVVIQWWTTFWSPAYYWLVSALRRRKIHCVFSIHNILPHEKRFFDTWATRQVLAKGNACITYSPKEEERLKQIVPDARNYSARLSVFDMLHNPIDRDAARNILGVSSNQVILLFFGFVRKYKGLDVLLDALKIARDQGTTPLVFVSGEFWEDVGHYQARINELDLKEQVIIDNRYIPNEETAALFSAADGFVAPYTAGSQSAAIKIAMAYGMPVLASQSIAADLPAADYPIMIHETGNAAGLASDIEALCLGKITRTSPMSSDADWQRLLDLLLKVESDMALLSQPPI